MVPDCCKGISNSWAICFELASKYGSNGDKVIFFVNSSHLLLLDHLSHFIDIRTNITNTWTYWWCDKMALSFLISHKCYKQHINAKLFFDLRNDRPLQVIYWSLLQNNDLPLKCSRCHFIFFPLLKKTQMQVPYVDSMLKQTNLRNI